MSLTPSPRATLTLALDTNVVLDWLVFEDARTNVLREGALAGRIAVITHAPALDELRRVLTYPQFRLDATMQNAVMESYVAQCEIATLPEGFSLDHLMLPAGFPRCRDRDDEHFLALAYHTGVDALVSKDKDLLRVKKRAGKFGVKVLNVPQLSELFHQTANGLGPHQAL